MSSVCLAFVRLYKGYSSISSCNAWLTTTTIDPLTFEEDLIKNTIKSFHILTFILKRLTSFGIMAAHLSSIELIMQLRLSYLSQCSLAARLGVPRPYSVRLAQPTMRLMACMSQLSGISQEMVLFRACVYHGHPGALLVWSSLPLVLGTHELCLSGT